MIHILYRATQNKSGIGKHRPSWFTYSKCLNSILGSVSSDVRIHLLYDGDELENVDSRIYTASYFTGGTDWDSYIYAWNYASNLQLNSTDLIYISENDYIHLPNWHYKILELYNSYNCDYVSLYDHPDKYDLDLYPNLDTRILVTKTHHWRLTPSTTGNCIFPKHILYDDIDIHTTVPSDLERFNILTKYRNRSILSPIPSLSTHCESQYLAPTINWEGIV